MSEINIMKTITYNVYKFNELSDNAKQVAIDEWRANDANDDMTFLFEDMQDQCSELLENNKIEGEARVYYSLASCQGDGAMFEGSFYWNGHNVNIKHSGRYYHSYSKNINIVNSSLDDSPDASEAICEEFEALYQDICAKLEKYGYEAIDYRHSEESISETLIANDYDFRENGSIDYSS